jgi:3-oxoacyl-[acyl-carrier-protein] synthase-3
LLVTSAAFSKLVPVDLPASPWFGDGATAVVVGSVGPDRGILAYTHGTDGTRCRGMIFGVPGKRWYEDGRVVLYPEDRSVARATILGSIDRGRDSILETLAKAGKEPNDVDFYACHQGVPWLRAVTQDYAGMTRARWVDTFAQFASLGAANLPFVMSIGERDRLLRDGDLVMLFSGGSGETWSSLLLRWGRG